MMFIAVIVGILTGNIDAVTQAAIDMAKTAVEIAIGLIGIMALWPVSYTHLTLPTKA